MSGDEKKRVLVVGVSGNGRAGLPPKLLSRIEAADELWGGRRLLAEWADHPAEKIVIGANIRMLLRRAEARGSRRMVVLASGDPLFFGIGATLLEALPRAEVELIPAPSSLQESFARAGLSWSDAVFTSAHARPLTEVVGWARRAPKLGILTDAQRTPAVIARVLLESGLPDCRALVAENLGGADERLTDTRLAAVPEMVFAPLNVLLLVQDQGWQPRPTFALRPASAYAHRRGLITKRDVRALSLARLALREGDVVWDVGAGSGAVSVEIAEIAWRGRVFAVERDEENLGYIRQNCRRYGALNVEVVPGAAPAALADLPAPDAVFIGGSGGQMVPILEVATASARPGGRIVVTLATLENLTCALEAMTALGLAPELCQATISHGKALAGLTRLAPLNPIFILNGVVADGDN